MQKIESKPDEEIVNDLYILALQSWKYFNIAIPWKHSLEKCLRVNFSVEALASVGHVLWGEGFIEIAKGELSGKK